MSAGERLVLYEKVKRQGRLGSDVLPFGQPLDRNDYRVILKPFAGRELNRREIRAIESARVADGVAARDLVIKRESAPHRLNLPFHAKGERHSKPLSDAGYRIYRDGVKTLELGATKVESQRYADKLYAQALGQDNQLRRMTNQPIANFLQRFGVRFYTNPRAEVRKVVEGLMGQVPTPQALSLIGENVAAAIKVNFDEHNSNIAEQALKTLSNVVRKPAINLLGTAKSPVLDVLFDVIDDTADAVDGKTKHQVVAEAKLTAVDAFLSKASKSKKWGKLAHVAQLINNIGLLKTGFDQAYNVSQRALINIAVDGMTNPNSPFAAHKEALADAVLGAKGIFGHSLTAAVSNESLQQAEASLRAANHKANQGLDALYRLGWREIVTKAVNSAREVKAPNALAEVATMPEVIAAMQDAAPAPVEA